jgi:hypothetical protein
MFMKRLEGLPPDKDGILPFGEEKGSPGNIVGVSLVKFLVAVGMAVTRHPPHRSVRAELPHTAPASGQTQWRLSGYGSYLIRRSRRSVEKSDSQHPVASLPLSCTAHYYKFRLTTTRIHCSRSTLPLASVCRARSLEMDFPRPEGLLSTNSAGGWPNSRLITLVRSLHRYYAPVRLPSACMSRLRPQAFLDRTDRGTRSVATGISRFPCKEFAYMLWVFDSAGPVRHSRYRGVPILPSLPFHKVGTRIR